MYFKMHSLKKITAIAVSFSLLIPPTFIANTSHAQTPVSEDAEHFPEKHSTVQVEYKNVTVELPADIEALPAVQSEAIRANAKAIGQELYFAAKFQALLPETAFVKGTQIIEVKRDLYQAPQDNPTGMRDDVKLSSEHYITMASEGIIIVPRPDYKGMNDVWQANVLLQKGRKDIRITLNKSRASGLRQLFIYLPESIYDIPRDMKLKTLGMRFNPLGANYLVRASNIESGIKSTYGALRDTVGFLVGLVDKVPKYTDSEVEEMVKQATQNHVIGTVSNEMGPQDPYLKLHEEATAIEVTKILSRLYADHEKEWGDGYKKSVRASQLEIELRNEYPNLTEVELEDLVAERKTQSFMDRIQAASAEFENISTGLTQALFDHVKAMTIIFDREQDLARVLSDYQNNEAERLKRLYPAESQVEGWLENQVTKNTRVGIAQLNDFAYPVIVAKLKAAGLATPAAILDANYKFIRKNYGTGESLTAAVAEIQSEQDKIRANLQAQQKAAATYDYNVRLWGASKAMVRENVKRDGSVSYSLDRYKRSSTSTDWHFWNFGVLAQDTRYAVKNGLYQLLVANLYDGPFGVRSTFGGNKTYDSGWTVDSKTGELLRENTGRATNVTRWKTLQRKIELARVKFENEPNSGLSKNFRRPFHWFKNSVLVRGGGFAVIFGGRTAVFGLNVAGSLAGTVFAPMSGLIMLGFNAFIYDVRSPGPKLQLSRIAPVFNRLLLKLPIQGLAQTAVGIAGTFWHPALGATRLGMAHLRSFWSEGTDWLLRKTIFPLAGHVPVASNSVFRRIKGPGLTSEYVFQLAPEVSILGLQAALEKYNLSLFRDATLAQINAPIENYKKVVQNLFGSFVQSGALIESVRKQIEIPTDLHRRNFETAVQERFLLYSSLIGENVDRSLLRQNKDHLTKTLQLGTTLVREFFEKQVFAKKSTNEVLQIWAEFKLAENNWQGLTRKFLKETFSEDFLIPLEEADKTFRVVIKDEGLESLLKGLEGRFPKTEFIPEFDRPNREAQRRRRLDLTLASFRVQTVATACVRYFNK